MSLRNAQHGTCTLLAAAWRRVVGLGSQHVNFVSLHYAYFIFVSLLSSVVFWLLSEPKFSVAYVDSLFMVVSGVTETGLNTVDLSKLTTAQQVLLCLLMICGSAVWVSIWLISARKRSFCRLLAQNGVSQPQLDRRQSVNVPYPGAYQNAPDSDAHETKATEGDAGQFGRLPVQTTCFNSTTPLGSRNTRLLNLGSEQVLHQPMEPRPNPLAFLTSKNIGRNGDFINLTSEEKIQVSSIEHKVLQLLSLVVPLYFTLWQVLGCVGLGAWIATNQARPALENGINPWWLGIFNGVSAFNNSGMSLLDANMVPFQAAYYVLVTMGLLILAGNTAYPIFLRFILWSVYKVLNVFSQGPLVTEWQSTLEYILRYPRRVYTNLFPTQHTWWLAFMVVMLNGIDWAAFELLNIGNPVISAIPSGPRIMDGLFQAVAVRSGGFYIVPIAKTHIGLQVLYVIMMYISVYPVIITMRNSNVYEERSLGMFAAESTKDEEYVDPYAKALRSFRTRRLFISQQIRGQLADDIWLLALATFIITVMEAPHFAEDPVSYSVFNIIFEIISAYGCVGISVGSPGANYSFCGGWRAGSKLVVCLVMLRGRHRTLPASLDYAVRPAGKDIREEAFEEDTEGRRRPS
ncbi:potassium transporter, putative [Metarhizium acridum CQMa 102]|uniref:Potassium transporter, putative n=1 Tax=Metarhizium acridum (strain CQMa 102) TaxID=655827 RepID=E9EAQ5_METAQ|nr:potassium transporter, putative [Metarhizium acridum CQMa 102]EFY87055.1 potassium transporter, putative [Metarhizium acridum CQMa 102]